MCATSAGQTDLRSFHYRKGMKGTLGEEVLQLKDAVACL